MVFTSGKGCSVFKLQDAIETVELYLVDCVDEEREHIAAVRTLLTAVKSTPKWINVNDEMPDDESTVVIFGSPIGTGSADYDVWLGYHDADGWFSVEGSQMIVTHWQDMPEPPIQS